MAMQVPPPWSEDEFFLKAVGTPHPMAAEPNIPDRTKRAIFNILTQSVEESTSKQKRNLEEVRNRAKELQEQEKQAKTQIGEAVRRVNEQKQILLTAELLKGIQYEDIDVAHRLHTGFPLTGTMPDR